MKYKTDLTAEQVRELLDYDPATGVFTWKVRRSGRAVAPAEAGTLHTTGYRQIRIEGSLYKAHRLAWLHTHGEWPEAEIDHINCERSDNRIENLREASSSHNGANVSIRADNTSGLKGASWDKCCQRWRAVIQKDRRQIHLGYFTTAEQAHEAYCKAANDLHGEFSRTA